MANPQYLFHFNIDKEKHIAQFELRRFAYAGAFTSTIVSALPLDMDIAEDIQKHILYPKKEHIDIIETARRWFLEKYSFINPNELM